MDAYYVHDSFVHDVDALCSAVLHDGVVYYGSVVDTHYHVMAAVGARVPDSCCGFVDCDGTYYSRVEAAQWFRSTWPALWRLLDNRDVLESVDYAMAAMLPRRGLTLEAGPVPDWAANVPVRQACYPT